MNCDTDYHIVIPFETRIIIQDREGFTDRLDSIKGTIGYTFDRNDNFTEIQCMQSDPVFGAWFGYDTKPGSNINVLMRFPKTVLEKPSKELYNDNLIIIGIFVDDELRVNLIKKSLTDQLEDNEEYKNGNICITTDTNSTHTVFHIYVEVKSWCKEIPEIYLRA